MAQRRSGFTLIELLIFAGIFALIIGAFITILIGTVGVQSSSSAQNEVATQGQDILQQIQYYIKQARLVDMPLDTAEGTLVLRENAPANDPTTFTLATGTLYLQQGATGTLQALSSPLVSVSGLSFTRHFNLNSTSSPYGVESVTYSFTVTTQGGSQGYSQTFGSSAVVLAPVPVIAMLQRAKTEVNGTSQTSISAALPRPVEAGDLLIAATANQSGATSSISDTLGNTWTLAASTSYPAYSSTLALFYAANASSGVMTTTATFGGAGGSSPSLFLFEYRAAVTNMLDTAGGQIVSNTAAPTTTSLSPSWPQEELLFALDMLGSPTNVSVSPGSGYTMEASSTSGYSTQVFAEDMNQYIENPVAASWSLSAPASSTALMATFASAIQSYDIGMAGHWNFDEGAGTTAYDISGNGNNGTWGGSTPYYTTGMNGGYAGDFNGSNDGADLGIPASLQLQTMTLTAWIDATNNNATRAMFGGSGSGDGYYEFRDNSSNKLELLKQGVASIGTSVGTVPAGTWTFVAVTYDSSGNYIFYINGAAAGSGTNKQTFTYGGDHEVLGKGYSTAEYFNGAMDNMRIYSRVLSASEIQALYNAQS